MGELVSVVMCAYREREDHLRIAVESILQQTYTNIELIIVVDDPANRNLIKVLNDYKTKDNRIKLLVNEKNMGPSLSRNKGYSISSGSFIAIMDADDVSRNDRIEIQYRYMASHPNVGVVFSNRIIINEESIAINNTMRIINASQIRKALEFGNILTNPTAFIRKSAITDRVLYRNIACSEDYDLWLRMISDSVEIHELDHQLLSYRIRENSLSHANDAKVWAGAQYSRLLFKQRKKNGCDSYSSENYEEYLGRSVVKSNDRMNRFNNSYYLYTKGLDYIKTHSYSKGIQYWIKAIIKDKEILKVIYYAFRTQRCVK